MIFPDRARRQSVWMLALLALLLIPRSLFAQEFKVTLDVTDGSQKSNATNPAEQTKQPLSKRPAFHAAADAKLTAHWKVTYLAKPAMNDVLVHFYVVKIDRPGQAPPPLVPKDVPLESALTMDFQTGVSTEAKLELRLADPGIYLLRIEATGATEPCFAEMEVVVK